MELTKEQIEAIENVGRNDENGCIDWIGCGNPAPTLGLEGRFTADMLRKIADIIDAPERQVPRCRCCGTTENLHFDAGSGGPYRCDSDDCMVF